MLSLITLCFLVTCFFKKKCSLTSFESFKIKSCIPLFCFSTKLDLLVFKKKHSYSFYYFYNLLQISFLKF